METQLSCELQRQNVVAAHLDRGYFKVLNNYLALLEMLRINQGIPNSQGYPQDTNYSAQYVEGYASKFIPKRLPTSS